MANPLGAFSPDLVAAGWFDETMQPAGWLDQGSITIEAGGVDVAVTLDVGAVVVSGQAPSAASGVSAAASVGAVAVAGFAPIAVASASASVGVGSAEILGFAPAVVAGSSVTALPGLGAVVIASGAVTVSVGVSAGLGLGDVAISGLAPLPSISVAIGVGLGGLNIVGFAPAVSITYKNVTCNLVSRTGFPMGGLASLQWAWFDSIDPSAFGAPSAVGLGATNPLGALALNVSGTSLPEGENGTLVLRSSDGVLIGAFTLPVGIAA